MIYLVTEQGEYLNSNLYKVISVEESLRLLDTITNVGLDIETDGLDPHLKNILLLQLGNKDFQVVIDCTTVDILQYKSYLEDPSRLFIGWNLKFDIQFLYNYDIIPRKIHDGFIAEKIIWLGYPEGSYSLSLKSAAEHYLNISLDKSIRETIGLVALNDDIIKYAAEDVVYLEDIMNKQIDTLRERGQLNALKLENFVVPVTAYFEYCGIKLDVEKWRVKMERDREELNRIKNELDEYIVKLYSLNPTKFYPFVSIQPKNLFCSDELITCNINWSSSQQLAPLLESLGFNLEVKDKQKGGTKISTGVDVIAAQRQIDPIADLLIKYSKANKVVTTYGQSYLDLIHPITGRIHTSFNQIGTNTYRYSSGKGVNKELKPGKTIKLVNLQNLPATHETRSCFISEDNNLWISIDYSGEESIILANISRDESMIDLFLNGCGDLHSLVAKMCFPKELKDIPVEKIKDTRPDLRKKAKVPEFAFNYGGGAHTLTKKGIPLEEAIIIEKNYKEGFKGIAAYQDYQISLVLKTPYIESCPEIGYKFFVYHHDKLKTINNNLRLIWNEYLENKNTNPENQVVQKVKWFFKTKSDKERNFINYPIQTRGSAILKISLVFFFWWVVKNRLFKKVLFISSSHDENNIEAPKDIAELVANKLHECMIKAGSYICKIVPLDAEISRLDDGTLPNYWLH